ncbi:MAG: TIM barrel protein [Clostridiales bacterium]|jgi:deoxyribonuclease-4|nr:TIM barrel protein [Clostridiales bacterium]
MKQHTIRFGPAGNSASFYNAGHKSTLEMPAWVAAMSLNAFEYSFGRGVRLSDKLAGEIGEKAKEYDVQLSVHMPYYINLATDDPEKQANTKRYFLQSMRAARFIGATRGVFHPGTAGAATGPQRRAAFERAYQLFRSFLKEFAELEDFQGFTLCPETMGKLNQLGDLDEILAICNLDKQLLPCIDFGHLHCRGLGAINTIHDYAAILDKTEKVLGVARARNMHIHFSKIEFTKAGERMHRTFAEEGYGPDFAPLLELLAERRYTPIIICESNGTMAEDALVMKKFYENYTKTRNSP